MMEKQKMNEATTQSDRASIAGWLASYCEDIQQRARTSHGRFRAVAICELTTARAILRAIETGADMAPPISEVLQASN